jgi:phage FluMu protein Com
MAAAKKEGRSDEQSDEIRCDCGQLVARWYEAGIQIKCKRCRRLVSIPFAEIRGSPHEKSE